MPNSARAKEKVYLAITMAGVKRLHHRYLSGMKYSLILGDELTRDYHWINHLERILLGSGYMTQEEIRKVHDQIDVHWRPEYNTIDAEDEKL